MLISWVVPVAQVVTVVTNETSDEISTAKLAEHGLGEVGGGTTEALRHVKWEH